VAGTALGANPTSSIDAVPGGEAQRVIVHLRGGPETKATLGRAPGDGDTRRVNAVEAVISSALAEIARRVPASEIRVVSSFRLQPAFTAELSAAALAQLRNDPMVRAIEPDRRWRLQTLEGLPLIGADILHQQGISGEGTAVAVIDSGVDYLHPSLGGGQIPNAKVVYGIDIADGDADPMDCNGHGTAVTSVAAGSSYQWSPNRRFAGGVAPAAKILAYKVTTDDECGIATTSAVVEAIEDAVLRREGDGYHLAAINISLGGGEYAGPCDEENIAYGEAIATATDAGISVVSAAGNNGYTDALNVPACIPQALSVGSAWDSDPGFVPFLFCLDPECHSVCDDSYRWRRSVTCYSNSDSYLDLVAPSEYLKAAEAGGITVDFGGTSGAAAYVTGAAALVAQALPNITPSATKYLLAATGTPTMDDKNGLVRPMLDLAAALAATERVAVSSESSIPIHRWPDSPTVSTIMVDREGVVGHLDVLVDLVHPHPEDLRLTLRSPDGIEVVLHDHTTAPGGLAGVYPNDLAPRDSLGLFSGTPTQGQWALSVDDDGEPYAADGLARLVGWALSFEDPQQPPYADTTMVFPVVAHVEGAQDTDWRSDLRIFNATPGREAEIRLLLIPPSGEAAPPRQTDVIVPHGSVVALDDLVTNRFGLTTGQGSLLVQDPAGTVIHGTSRTYTTNDSGTYGQFVAPSVAGSASTGAGDPALIILPTAGVDHRVNIGITEISGLPATVAVTLLDSSNGVALGPSTFHIVEPYANLQLNSVLPDTELANGTDPYVAVAVVQGDGRIVTYGSVIDNRTGDAVFITGESPTVAAYLLVPVVANNQGQAGTEWRTDLRVLNYGSFSVHVDAELRFQGAFGVPPVIKTFALQPGEAITIDDVVGTLFGFENVAGSLRLVPREGPAALAATSRTANHGPVGTYGQYVRSLAAGRGLDERGVLIHLDKGESTRSNLGIVETDGMSVSLEIRLFDHLGKTLGWPKTVALGPWESTQVNDIFNALGADDHRNAGAEITKVSGSGGFFAYASVIDANSGDAIFVPVLELPSSPEP